MSILLAIAVVSTIVLAAFSTAKSAETSITFGGGVTLEISNETMNSTANWIIKSVDNDGTVGSDITGNASALTTGAQFASFKVKNTSGTTIAIAFKLTTSGDADLFVGATPNEDTALVTANTDANYGASGATQQSSGNLNGWYVITSVADEAEATLTEAINTVYKGASIAGLDGGENATLTLQITAVIAGTDAISALDSAVAEGGWTAIKAGEVEGAA